MGPKIGLTGLGRIGRNIFRILNDPLRHADDDPVIVAVSDRADRAALAHLLRFDTLLGRFPGTIRLEGDELEVNGRRIRMVASPAAGSPAQSSTPANIDWRALGVDTVIDEHPGSRERSERHLTAGARRVILCAPAVDPPDLTVVMGVNDGDLRAEQRIVSAASPSANAAAPLLAVLGDAFGIRRAFLSVVHAYTGGQALADVPAADPRQGRAAAENIIPRATAAAGVIMEIMPALRGKLSALALDVPMPNGSAVDAVCWHERPVSVEEVNRVARAAAAAPRFAGILDYEEAPIVSSDILHSAASATFDSQATMVLAGNVSKTLAWFDNDWGYAHRVVDLVRRFSRIDKESSR